MNLQHERMLSLCEALSLPFVAQGYASAAQDAVEHGTAYSDFLEELLKTEASGRRVRKQSMLTRLAGFPAIKTLEEFDYNFAAGVKRSVIGSRHSTLPATAGTMEKIRRASMVPASCPATGRSKATVIAEVGSPASVGETRRTWSAGGGVSAMPPARIAAPKNDERMDENPCSCCQGGA